MKEEINPLLGIHAQQYRFFTQLAVRTGLLWKIPPDRALRPANSPFCIRGAVMSFCKTPLRKTITQRKTGSNSLYPSSYKTPYLSPTLSTTRCQKNYLKMPQSMETINKKKKENGKKSLMSSFTLSIFQWVMETTLGKGLGDVPLLYLFYPK